MPKSICKCNTFLEDTSVHTFTCSECGSVLSVADILVRCNKYHAALKKVYEMLQSINDTEVLPIEAVCEEVLCETL